MEKKHVKIIRDNLPELVKITNKLDDVISKLADRNVFNEYMVKYLRKNIALKSQLYEFYEMIQGRGPTAFDALVNVMRETENFRVEQLLCGYKLLSYGTFETNSNHGESNVQKAEDTHDSAVTNASDVTDMSDVPNVIVQKHPENKFMDVNEDNKPGGTYHMRSRPRGHALLINIHETVNLKDRAGSEIDAEKLYKLFSDMGYEVVKHSNLTYKDMKTEIQTFNRKRCLKEGDSVVVFVMCHGVRARSNTRSVDLITSDGNPLNSDWIIEQFMSDKSPSATTLNERKPKMFFFQACRVEETNTQIRWFKSTDPYFHPQSRRALSTLNYEDTFVTFATVSGFPSMRDPLQGSWFVNAFCDVVANHAWQYDLDAMMGMVHDEVRTKESKHGYQTLEFVKLGPGLKVFFNPGLFENEVDEADVTRL